MQKAITRTNVRSYQREAALLRAWLVILFLILPSFAATLLAAHPEESVPKVAYLRASQVGYLASDSKVALALAHEPLVGEFSVVDSATGDVAWHGPLKRSPRKGWGTFDFCYELDFSRFTVPGQYLLRLDESGETSRPFRIGPQAYGHYVEDLLAFMRQQRCGYNPLLDSRDSHCDGICHQRDGRTAYGPLPAGTFVDASGGWHDAGDQLKYLLTSSNATARMLLAYELEPTKFSDRVDHLGRQEPNGVPDVLDEARWGLDWIHKLHPAPDQLYHQVADDRDHNGWKKPDEDPADYGWGPNSYRVLYFADGKPQGLAKYQSESTGLANLAGRCAAAMAAGHRVWSKLGDQPYADRCLQAARELYALGKQQEGFQQGNSYGAPYRYSERTWADDMEWGAAELFRETGEEAYLEDAKRYARLAGDISWMPHEKAGHYEYYPFVNVGHFALYPHVDKAMQQELAGYYRSGLDATLARGETNPYGVGVPFIWCSNNLTVALITQGLLYERMTGDTRYHTHILAQRDWLMGCNPWGTTMFTGIPRNGETPRDVHTSVWKLLGYDVPGGLVDGPVYRSVYEKLLGLHLEEPDEFAPFQNSHVVYHDDVGDYSTNEPTMDGTAGAVYMMAHFGAPVANSNAQQANWTMAHGAVVRGDTASQRLALIFTGGEQTDGAEEIVATLADKNVKASFFVTGDFLDQPGMETWVRHAIARGHYVGPHSHAHLLYAPWENRERSLVTQQEFSEDLRKNLAELRQLGAAADSPVWFIPPYEWYNAQHVEWARQMGCRTFNFTPGTGSNRDFAPEEHRAFKSSRELLSDILAHEKSSATGLNGHLLLLHLGSERKDRMPPHLGKLIDTLRERGYQFERIDALLEPEAK